MKFELLRIETNPQLANVATASERVVVVQGELMLGDASGTIKFCLPTKCLENVHDLLLGVWPVGDVSRSTAQATAASCYVPGLVELVAELASVRITASELATLRLGDIITTDTLATSPLTVSVDGTPRFHAPPGAFKGRRACASNSDSIRGKPPDAVFLTARYLRSLGRLYGPPRYHRPLRHVRLAGCRGDVFWYLRRRFLSALTFVRAR